MLRFLEIMNHEAAAFTRTDRDADAGLSDDEGAARVAAEREGTA